MCITAGIPGISQNPQESGFKKELRSFFAGTSRKSGTDHEGLLKNTFLFCRNPFLLAKCLFTRGLVNPSFQVSWCNFRPIVRLFRCHRCRLLYRCRCAPPPHHQHCRHHHHRKAHPWRVVLVAVINAPLSALASALFYCCHRRHFYHCCCFCRRCRRCRCCFFQAPFS